MTIRDRVCIVGVGYTPFSRHSGRSDLQLAVEACRSALADAGLELKDIDGLHSCGGRPDDPGPMDMIRVLGLPDVRWWARPPIVFMALHEPCLAVAAGLCNYMVSYRAISRPRGGGAYNYLGQVQGNGDQLRATGASAFTVPYGLGPVGQYYASRYQRYIYEFGSTYEQLGTYVIGARRNATLNEKAVFTQPLTMEDYLNARWVWKPMRLLDTDMPVDAAAALVITTSERARDLKQRPVFVRALGAGQGRFPDWIFREDYTVMSYRTAGDGLWDRAEMSPADMDFAMLYDGFSPFIYYWLEELGFVGRGGAASFVGSGALALGGTLPTNTFGGALSEGRLEGFNHYVEATLQLQGRAGPRQVDNARSGIIGGGGLVLPGVAIVHN
jgi:acetyl-CoA acetyltransferase